MIIVKVIGIYSPRRTSMDQVLAEMLKYDGGEILEIISDESIRPDRENSSRKFEVLVSLETYTPERWSSFGLRTRSVEGGRF